MLILLMQSMSRAVLLLAVLATSLQSEAAFPRIMWNYWHSGEEGMPLFTKLCVNNHRHYARRAGIEFRLVSQATLTDYVDTQLVYSTYDRIPPEHRSIQKLVDLIRFQLLIRHGGMWIDADTYFIRDLSWFDSPQHCSLFFNKASDFPSIILPSFSLDFHDIVHDEERGIDIEMNYSPGDEFILAMPRSQFLLDHWAIINESLTLGKAELQANLRQEGARFSEQHTAYMHTWLSVGLETMVLWRKEHELNVTRSNFSNVFEYYNLWLLDSRHNHYLHVNYYDSFDRFESMFSDLCNLTSLELLKKWTKGVSQEPPLFIKFINSHRGAASKVIDQYKLQTCRGKQTPIHPDSQLKLFLIQLYQQGCDYGPASARYAIDQPCSHVLHSVHPVLSLLDYTLTVWTIAAVVVILTACAWCIVGRRPKIPLNRKKASSQAEKETLRSVATMRRLEEDDD